MYCHEGFEPVEPNRFQGNRLDHSAICRARYKYKIII